MNAELDKQLCDKYPKIFVERSLSVMESCMGRGIECGDGWYVLLDTVCDSIQRYIDGSNSSKDIENHVEQVIFQQVKEKFGMLTIYYKGGDAAIHGMIEIIMKVSLQVCEMCGTNQNVTSDPDHWKQMLCPACNEKRWNVDYLKKK